MFITVELKLSQLFIRLLELLLLLRVLFIILQNKHAILLADETGKLLFNCDLVAWTNSNNMLYFQNVRRESMSSILSFFKKEHV